MKTSNIPAGKRLAHLILILGGWLALSAGGAQAGGLSPSFGCSVVPTLNPNDPNFLGGDLPKGQIVQQATVDCYAWQSFVALNWPVDPSWPATPANAGQPDRNAAAATWGAPIDPSKTDPVSTVWESYMPVQSIFVAAGQTPNAWGVMPPAAQCGQDAGAKSVGMRQLTAINKFGTVARSKLRAAMLAADVNPDSFDQAAGGWLTDQTGQLVWYEKAVDQAEYAYLMAPDQVQADALYTAAGQLAVAKNSNGKHPNGLFFPPGVQPGNTVQTWDQIGAIEIKAAWRNLTHQPQLWPRYLLAKASLKDPDSGNCSTAIMGLVGLHIIRATNSRPDFIWATFEHIDNAPDQTPQYTDPYTHPHGWSFNNPDCQHNCQVNAARIDGSGKPLYSMSAPVQVARVFSIPAQVMQLNLAMQQLIRQSNSQSVFQYYQLVNVLWDQSPTLPITQPNKMAPLGGSFTSSGPVPVANTTLETYAQTKNCTVCHAGAPISGGSLASDFSFIFLSTQP